jgi:hypothetical protein
MERMTRFELATSTLARLRSTTELHPRCRIDKACYNLSRKNMQEEFHGNYE